MTDWRETLHVGLSGLSEKCKTQRRTCHKKVSKQNCNQSVLEALDKRITQQFTAMRSARPQTLADVFSFEIDEGSGDGEAYLGSKVR